MTKRVITNTNRDFKGVWIPAKFWLDESISTIEMLFLTEIDSLSVDGKPCFASNRHFADFFGVSAGRSSQVISKLTELGRIIVKYDRTDTGQVLKRYITISSFRYLENDNGVFRKHTGGIKKTKGGYLENIKESNTVISNTTSDTNNKTVNKVDLEKRFNELWKLYPNKKGKPVALRAYKNAIKDGVTDDEVRSGINKYLTEIKVKQTEQQYIKHGSTWFNQKAWEDDYETSSVVVKGTQRETLPDWARDDYEPPKKEKADPAEVAEIRAKIARLQKEAT